MKYCPICGQRIPSDAIYCMRCEGSDPEAVLYEFEDRPTDSLKAASFLIPLVGLILFIMNYNTKPESAGTYGKYALTGFILGSAVTAISFTAAFTYFTMV